MPCQADDMQVDVIAWLLSHAGKALRAKALKAAAEAAAQATSMPSSPIAPTKADAMTQFSIAAEHAEQGRPGNAMPPQHRDWGHLCRQSE